MPKPKEPKGSSQRIDEENENFDFKNNQIFTQNCKNTDELRTGYGYYAQLAETKDIWEFRVQILELFNTMGFTDFSFVRLDATEDIDNLLLNTIPKVIPDSYYENCFFLHDVMLSYAQENDAPIFRSSLEELIWDLPFKNETTETMSGVYKLCSQYGYFDFYNIPAPSKDGKGRTMLTLAARGATPFDLKENVNKYRRDITLLHDAIDDISLVKYPEYIGIGAKKDSDVSISNRQLALLSALANEDQNIKTLSKSLCLSESTANQYLGLIRNRYGVTSNYAAIKKALLAGHIYYSMDGRKYTLQRKK